MKSAVFQDLAIIVAVSFFGFIALPLLSIPDARWAFAMGAIITGCVLAIARTYIQPTATKGKPVHDSGHQTGGHDVITTTLYIGNLAYKVSESSIKAHFSELGYVKSVRLMTDKRTGKKKGFGFVEVESGAADDMITQLNDTTFHERTLKVRRAKEKRHSD